MDQEQNKPDLAVKDYQQALQIAPNAGEPIAALVRLEMDRKQPAAAMAHVTAALAKSATNPVALRVKGELLLVQGQNDAAIAAYQDTIKAYPAWADGIRGWRWCSFGPSTWIRPSAHCSWEYRKSRRPKPS